MKILLSPAKTLDFESTIPSYKSSEAVFTTKADRLNRVLQKKSPKKLAELMHISMKLAELNWERNQEWEKVSQLRQATYAFKGAAYVGLDAYSISTHDFDYFQNTLRMLSGQYGILRPFDLIKPYRLEMGTKLVIGRKKNLYDFWGENITKELNGELEENEIVVNLASNEYFKVIKPKLLNAEIITPIFKDYKNGQYKVLSFFAKKARGLMTRYAVDNQIENVEQLKTFNIDSYAFDEKLSSDLDWVFTR